MPPSRPHRHTLTLRVPEPFELRLALFGHGWIDLAPHAWDETRGRWSTTVAVGRAGRAVDVSVRAGPRGALTAAVTTARPLGRRTLDAVRDGLRRTLALDVALEAFWSTCAREPRLGWVARRGGGRLMRSPTLFEDLLKLLFTTNCSWSNTKSMTGNLVTALGSKGPSGARAFPTATQCAGRDEAFWRDVVRVGYRARACHHLAAGFASGTLTDATFTDPEQSVEERRARLLELPGFGPYAAGLALRLLGDFDDLALDSWCRAELARLDGRRKPPTDRAVERRYRAFGPHRGLALWMDLTARWHGEGPLAERHPDTGSNAAAFP